MREALRSKQTPQNIHDIHTHVRYDEKSDFVDSYLMCCSSSFRCFRWFLFIPSVLCYPLLSIPLFVYRLVCTWVEHSVRVTVFMVIAFISLCSISSRLSRPVYSSLYSLSQQTFWYIFTIGREKRVHTPQKKHFIFIYLHHHIGLKIVYFVFW